ncbi:4-coumarate--CoA ligase family protein [soil metagenome]
MALHSPHPDIEVPAVSLPSYVLEHADALGDKAALVDGPSGRTLSYAQLARSVRRLAAGLSAPGPPPRPRPARGWSKGDVFGILAPNSPEYAVAFHGVALAGGVLTTMNPTLTPDELSRQLGDAGARYLLTVPQLLGPATEAARSAGVEEVFVLGGDGTATPFSALLHPDPTPPSVEIDPARDLVALPYSSGTTGFPKGVMLTHRNLVANVRQTGAVLGVRESDTVIGVLPFFHIYGMTVILNVALRLGATVVTMPRFDLEQLLRLLQDHRVTRAYLVPPIVLALAKHPAVDDYDLTALDVILSGAAPLGPELAGACGRRLGCEMAQGYGLTETSPVTHLVPGGAGGERLGSVGPLVPGTEGRIVDPDSGEDLGAERTGELWVRGPQVMRGYLHDEEATAAVLDADGWLHTGDLARVDDDGWLYLVDRLKELIKYKGYQVAPAELEAVLLDHDAVRDAAVVPEPDEEAGEVPKAFVVVDGDVTPDELMAFVAKRVAPYKRVRRVELIDEIPKTASGKVLRRELRDAG